MYKIQMKSISKWRWIFLFAMSVVFAAVQVLGVDDWTAKTVDNLLYYFAPTAQASAIAQMYLYALPLVAMILSGGLWGREKHSHRLISDYARINHRSWVKTTFMNNFLLGGISVSSPLIFNVIFGLFRCHHFENTAPYADYGLGFNPVGKFWAGDFLNDHPIYGLIFIIMIYFLYGGIFACIGMICSYLLKYRYIEYFLPFVIYFAYILFTSVIGMEDWNPVFYLYIPCAVGVETTGISLFIVTFVLLIGIFIGYRKMVQHDVLD